MNIEAHYNPNYKKYSVEVVADNTRIIEDWLSEGEVESMSLQFKNAYLEFTGHKLYRLLEEALDDMESLESVDSEEYDAILLRLTKAIALLDE